MDYGVLSYYLTPQLLIALIPLAWLLYRLKHVFDTPVEDLVGILGIEVPSAPHVSLLAIDAFGVKLRWQTSDQRSAGLNFGVTINGVTIGELDYRASAVKIAGLLPATHYIIRIVAINQARHKAASEAIRVRTFLENEIEGEGSAARKRLAHDASPAESKQNNTPETTNPVLIPFNPVEDAVAPLVALPMTRDNSSSGLVMKRRNSARTVPFMPNGAKSTAFQNQHEQESIEELNDRLERVREQQKEQDELDTQEEAEFEALQAELLAEREDLRLRMRERDDQNRELNRSVRALEHAHGASERRRQQLQKAVDDKRRERSKLQEDMKRWDAEIPGIEAECESAVSQKQEFVEDGKRKLEEIKEEQKPDLEALAAIEEQIQDKGREVAELESEVKRTESDMEDGEVVDSTKALALESNALNDTLLELQAQLSEANAGLYQARATYHHLSQQIDLLAGSRRGSVANGQAVNHSPTTLDADLVASDQTYSPLANRVNFELPASRQNPMSTQNRTPGPISSLPARGSLSPFASAGALNIPPRYTSADLESEPMTAGPLVSPSANGLLPSGLFGEDDAYGDMVKPRLRSQHSSHHLDESSPRSRPLSTNLGAPTKISYVDEDPSEQVDALPGLGDSEPKNSPNSPSASLASNSPSLVSSPRSIHAFSRQHKSSDPNLGRFGGFEFDQRSIHSASSLTNTGTIPSRGVFSFGINRQRGKTQPGDGPQLGSLKAYQTQSMPRDAAAANSSSYGRDLIKNLMTTRFGNSRNAPAVSRFGSSGSFGPIGPPSTSRPSSNYSTDNSVFPKPSNVASRFGWGASKENLGRNDSVHSATIWSDSPWNSRRPSVQEIMSDMRSQAAGGIAGRENGDSDGHDEFDYAAEQTKATKPKGSSSLAAQLNPTARDFTSVFGFGKKADKGEKTGTKAKKKARSSTEDLGGSELTEEPSPSNSRKSRDTHPSSYEDSLEDVADDLEQLPSSLMENQLQPSPSGRSSLMRRITRKGSSGKFGLPTLKDKKEKGSGLFSRKAAANVPEEGDDESVMGRSIESILSSTPGASSSTSDKRSSAFSLSSLRSRRSKKAHETASTYSEVSLSETGDEDDGTPSIDWPRS